MSVDARHLTRLDLRDYPGWHILYSQHSGRIFSAFLFNPSGHLTDIAREILASERALVFWGSYRIEQGAEVPSRVD